MTGPFKKWKEGQIELTCWENDSVFGGETKKTLSFNIKKSYKDKDGEWKESKSFARNNLLPLAKLLEKGFEETNKNVLEGN